jgi:hypothetical protein
MVNFNLSGGGIGSECVKIKYLMPLFSADIRHISWTAGITSTISACEVLPVAIKNKKYIK